MKYKFIAITEESYDILKRLGNKGDTFGDIVSEVIKRANLPKNSKLLEATV